MSTSYKHIRMTNVDTNGNESVYYPENTGKDVSISRASNTNIPSGVSTAQDLANKLVSSAFNVPINDSSTSGSTTWSSNVINNKLNNISTYVGTDGLLHFKDAAGVDTTLNFKKAVGDATTDDVLSGKHFSVDGQSNLLGTMPNNGAKTYEIAPNSQQTIILGYHNGNGYVKAKANTETFSATTRAANIDMGIANLYRYVNTTGVPNNNNTTYTFTNSEDYTNKDLGVTNTYRYINATAVYNRGKADGVTTHTTTYKPTLRKADNDMGVNHTYRYVDTTAVPNANNDVKSITSLDTSWLTGNVDMGAANTYRYVNATAVYAKGKEDGVTVHTTRRDFAAGSTGSDLDLGITHTVRYVGAGEVYTKGHANGYSEGQTAGYSSGYSAGQTAGYNSGYSAGRESVKIAEFDAASQSSGSGNTQSTDWTISLADAGLANKTIKGVYINDANCPTKAAITTQVRAWIDWDTSTLKCQWRDANSSSNLASGAWFTAKVAVVYWE